MNVGAGLQASLRLQGRSGLNAPHRVNRIKGDPAAAGAACSRWDYFIQKHSCVPRRFERSAIARTRLISGEGPLYFGLADQGHRSEIGLTRHTSYRRLDDNR
jgi:hypothetical protein